MRLPYPQHAGTPVASLQPLPGDEPDVAAAPAGATAAAQTPRRATRAWRGCSR